MYFFWCLCDYCVLVFLCYWESINQTRRVGKMILCDDDGHNYVSSEEAGARGVSRWKSGITGQPTYTYTKGMFVDVPNNSAPRGLCQATPR